MEANKKQLFLKSILIIQTIVLLVYTIVVFQNDGSNFLARAYDYILSLNWSGQFILDFNCYLMLSALWIAWRNKFTGSSLMIAIIAMIMGIIVFAPYLLFLISKEKGELKRVLIGER